MNIFNKLLKQFQTGEDLNQETAEEFITFLSDSESTEEEMGTLTSAWKAKGEKSDELVFISKHLLTLLESIQNQSNILDCCGTGGDNSGSFNISTTSSFIAAAAGVKIAKHGGRKTTSASGSIDFLEALQIPTLTNSQEIKKNLDEKGLVFIASPATQRILGRWKAVCRKLEFYGQTGLIGTLTNPVTLTYQIIGVPKYEWGSLMIESLSKLGRKKAIVVFGEPGLDELSLCGTNHLWFLENGKINEITLSQAELYSHLGINENSHFTLEDIKGADPETNAKIFLEVLNGKASNAILQTIYANTGLILWIAEKTNSLKAGMEEAKRLVQSGKAKEFYEHYQKQADNGT
ncbi:MAG: anthranilate phosphoribosyltransferase [Candidatus Melainabacteria bacterium]|jgi:anthranilate phosphoribosyltransferase